MRDYSDYCLLLRLRSIAFDFGYVAALGSDTRQERCELIDKARKRMNNITSILERRTSERLAKQRFI